MILVHLFKRASLFGVMLLLQGIMYAQTDYSPGVILSLEQMENTVEKNKSTCYQIMLTLKHDKAITLAGQNYRLYYDSENGLLNEKSIASLLPDGYTPLRLDQHFFDIDASGFGVLPYEGNLGFINISTDLNLNSSWVLELLPGVANTIGQFCFEGNLTTRPEITWSRDQLTHTYATAFVELSYYDGRALHKLPVTKYEVRHKDQLVLQEAEVFNVSMYPNPFKDELYMSFNYPLGEGGDLMIFDLFGKLVYKEKLQAGISDYRLDANRIGLGNGACLIEIHDGSGKIHARKAIKIE
jgi:hypothetical protein